MTMSSKRPLAAAAALTLIAGTLTSAPQIASAAETSMTVDFASPTGEFRGGSSGALYGLGDDGVPTRALLNGAHVTNVSQKAPYGTQHPSGDALKVEDDFFAKNGQDLYIYVQDYYPDWPYNGGRRPGDARTYDQADGTFTTTPNGVWDFLEVTEFVTQAVAERSDYPGSYVFIPFNEPDGGNWYPNWSTQKDQFLSDWAATYRVIQEVWARNGLGHARIGGPGDSAWHHDRSVDFLTYSKANDVLPDVFIWHELGITNLASYRSNYADYRSIEKSLGISPLQINITEFGMLRDMSTPGQLIQWFSMFEDTKVDAQTAYWNYAGNLSDNTARPNGANGGWWMFKWYGDLEGSTTVKVTPPQPNTYDTLQGIGAVDTDARRATVLLGGTDDDVNLDLRGLDQSVFGKNVDIEVREITLVGAEGLAATPRVVQALRDVDITSGATKLAIDTYDRYAAYQVLVTPSQDRDVTVDVAAQPWTAVVEAEDTVLTGARTYEQAPSNPSDLWGSGWKFLASHSHDVGSFNQVTSKSEWTLDVPRDGSYRYQVVGGAPGIPGRHALFVDGTFAGIVQYAADLGLNATSKWQYRGSAEITIPLTAGEHVLSLRASKDGVNRLPNSDITLDRMSLTDVTDGEPTLYPASTFRLVGGATASAQVGSRGFASLAAGQRADLYASAWDTGYQDVTIRYSSTAATSVAININGRDVTTVSAPSAGLWESTARVHLVEGINEIELTSPGAAIASLTTTRVPSADAAQVTIEAETGTLGGTAKVATLADSTGTNASGLKVVEFVGNGAANFLQLNRTAGWDAAGHYDLSVFYSNAELSGQHDYNPQVVDRRIQVLEHAAQVGSAMFRYTYSWTSFSQRTIPLTLATADQPIRLTNATAYAPNIDKVIVAPLTIGTPTTEAATPVFPLPTPTDSPTPPVSPTPSVEPSSDASVTPSASPSASAEPTVTATPSATAKPSVTATPSVPAEPGDLYSTPGYHVVNGRHWYTTCEPYSQTTRCTTYIWTSGFVLVNGKVTQRSGWVFNNLTYLPQMTRAQWGTNPLAHTGAWTAADGRHWTTECDTALTGANACRSFILTTQLSSTRNADGTWSHTTVQKWVVNNIVRFKVA